MLRRLVENVAGDTVRETLELINQMQADGVIGKYAIGGAVGATFYLDPAATLDVVIFVAIPSTPGSVLLSLSPIYDYLSKQGCQMEHEHVVIGDWPVQFLPPSNSLEEEAIDNAIETELQGVPTWVMRAEHLVAIALNTGRAKDHARILQFLEQNAVDPVKLSTVLEGHGLVAKWTAFEEKYVRGLNE